MKRLVAREISAGLVAALLFISPACAKPWASRAREPDAHVLYSCPITLPNGTRNPLRPPGCSGKVLPEQGFYGNHGNGKLWVTLPENGILRLKPMEDGRLGKKFPWWRHVCGRLTITGRRLDAPSQPLEASIPEGYGDTGFQATGVHFSTEGCWEVTGRAGDAELTFVLEVRKSD